MGATFSATPTEVIRRASVQLGLPTVANPYSTTNALVLQMRELLVSVGRALVKEHHWSHLLKTQEVTTTEDDSTYSFAADFDRLVPLTMWDRTNQMRGPGPLSPQDYQYLKALGEGVAGYVLVRFRAQGIEVYPDTNTPGDITFAFEYVSSYWVAVNGAPTVGTKETPTATNDVLLFNEELLVAALKNRWREEKGFDTEKTGQHYRKLLQECIAADSPSGVLDLGRRQRDALLIGEHNIPLTGWGS